MDNKTSAYGLGFALSILFITAITISNFISNVYIWPVFAILSSGCSGPILYYMVKNHQFEHKLNNKKIASVIVENIISDISDRRGLKREWGNIDKDIKLEIKETWTKMIHKELL